MEERKQCVRCGAHTYSRVCSVCRSMHLEVVDEPRPWGPRFSRAKTAAYVTELTTRTPLKV